LDISTLIGFGYLSTVIEPKFYQLNMSLIFINTNMSWLFINTDMSWIFVNIDMPPNLSTLICFGYLFIFRMSISVDRIPIYQVDRFLDIYQQW
jgi:hypothetical protein